MKITEGKIPGTFIFEPKVFHDERGWFMESWTDQIFKDIGLNINFVQDNHSYSKDKGILRGMHFQCEPKPQAKLVRCCRGAILDVIVDIRKGSPTYGEWFSVELSSENKLQLFVPRGFAHGYLILQDHTEVLYKLDGLYSGELDSGFMWNDPAVGIDWGIDAPILSEKDQNMKSLEDSDANFIFSSGY